MRIRYSDLYPQKAAEIDEDSSTMRKFAPSEENVAKFLVLETYKSNAPLSSVPTHTVLHYSLLLPKTE